MFNQFTVIQVIILRIIPHRSGVFNSPCVLTVSVFWIYRTVLMFITFFERIKWEISKKGFFNISILIFISFHFIHEDESTILWRECQSFQSRSTFNKLLTWIGLNNMKQLIVKIIIEIGSSILFVTLPLNWWVFTITTFKIWMKVSNVAKKKSTQQIDKSLHVFYVCRI